MFQKNEMEAGMETAKNMVADKNRELVTVPVGTTLFATLEKMNEKKATLLYSEIDRNPLFKGFAEKEDRSSMNVTFNLTNEIHKDAFDKLWNEAGISGIKGHRSVGGYRASIYNAMPIESIQVLVNAMQELEKQTL